MEPGTEFRMEQSFSERLKRYRKERNLTQQQLADALGVSNKSVSRWESGGGYPDVPLLVPLARALGVTADLGINCLGALVPELQDGIPYYSLLQRWFGVWEGEMRTRPDFFFVFRRWLWISFAVFVENAVLWGIRIWKQGR